MADWQLELECVDGPYRTQRVIIGPSAVVPGRGMPVMVYFDTVVKRGWYRMVLRRQDIVLQWSGWDV